VKHALVLDQERLKRREGERLGGEFDACPKYSDLAIRPSASRKGGRFDRLVFVASPYVAGPYVEGEYDIALPVTSPIVAALKSGYRDPFAAQRQ
jgi:hypothetical protein